MEYSFEHGIDHCGQQGIDPILYVGGRVTEQDFVERDLTSMRGVSIVQRGLPRGTCWDDLNLPHLFERLENIEYLRIEYDDPISLDALGAQTNLRYLQMDSPRVTRTFRGSMPQLTVAHVRWTDECTAKLEAPLLQKLTLFRPRSKDLGLVGHLKAMRELDVHYARSLQTLEGIQPLKRLLHLGLHDCPRLTGLHIDGSTEGPQELAVAGCKRFADASDAHRFTSLRKLSIYGGSRGPRTVRLGQLQSRVELELHGVDAA
ncbi:MAG: hypothetical protein V4739_16730 [Pseudomonadota bacterium]